MSLLVLSCSRRSTGVCAAANRSVRGKTPKSLNETQKSVEKFRQTTSLITARSMKNNPHLLKYYKHLLGL